VALEDVQAVRLVQGVVLKQLQPLQVKAVAVEVVASQDQAVGELQATRPEVLVVLELLQIILGVQQLMVLVEQVEHLKLQAMYLVLMQAQTRVMVVAALQLKAVVEMLTVERVVLESSLFACLTH
jgi:hypothetical protein